jgi:[ribosomal protein S5]-alanine N-acetyltransferase
VNAVSLPIETERLLIRAFEPENDFEPMVGVYSDPEVMQYIRGGAVAADAVRETLQRYARAQEERGFSSWAVVERTSGRPVGDVGFDVFGPTGDVELGWTLARAVWGRGYASEAAAACLAAGLEHLEVPRIVAVVDAENERSIRVAERIGMARMESVRTHGRPHLLFAVFAASGYTT